MKTGHLAKLDGTEQETIIDDFIVGEGSKWNESPPFNGEVFNCTITEQPGPGWTFNKKYCQWVPPQN